MRVGGNTFTLPGMPALVAILVAGFGSSLPAQPPTEEGALPLKIQLDPEVVVAQAEETGHRWGVWQFPGIRQPRPGLLQVTFSQTVDSAALSAKERRPAGVRWSTDGGRTWQAAEKSLAGCVTTAEKDSGQMLLLQRPPSGDVPRDELPPPVGTCDHGYNGVYTARDPVEMPDGIAQWHVMRKKTGEDEWERLPARVDDPDGAAMGYDSPDRDYAVMHWTWPMNVLSLPDGSWLAVFYSFRLGADRKPRPKWESYCLRSTDDGATWKFHGIIARDDDHPLAGYTEPWVVCLPDGSLLAALRTECAQSGPMYVTRSLDGGRTWDEPQEVHPFGVKPKLLVLDNGLVVLSFGRPGVHLLFSGDNGESWSRLTTLVEETERQTRTSGYTGLLPVGPDRFIIAYDEFHQPNEEGEPRKTILVREVTASR